MSAIRPSAERKRKAPATAFKKGQSGNPSGRRAITPEERTLMDMCKDKTPEALATILQIMAEGDNDRNKLTAATYIIDRGWGKAVQAIEHGNRDGKALEITVIERRIIDSAE